ncbi:hypothetical protein D3C73_958160 [compost metagenome]
MHHKFNIDDTSSVLLEIERCRGLEGIRRGAGPGALAAQVVAHLGAHLADLLAQGGQVPGFPQNGRTNLLERLTHIRTAHQHPRPHQGLVLPGPGFVFLIPGEGPQRTHQ